VAAGDEGINARGVYEKLIEWGYQTTLNAINVRLSGLANQGRIDRKWVGVYVGAGCGPDEGPGYQRRKKRRPASKANAAEPGAPEGAPQKGGQ
jgi:hypothetical protein